MELVDLNTIKVSRPITMTCPNCKKMVRKTIDDEGIHRSWQSFDENGNRQYFCANCKKTSST